MPVSHHHPQYSKWFPIWKKCRDAYNGQEAIHAAREDYLEKLSEEENDDYEKRLKRAVFYEAFTRTVEALLGMLFRKEPEINTDSELTEDIDSKGSGFVEQMKDAAEEALIINRLGVLVDFPTVSDGMTQADVEAMGLRPRANIYKTESIINWKTKKIAGKRTLTMVVLAEKRLQAKNEFEDEEKTVYRVLDLDDSGNYRVRLMQDEKGVDVVLDEFTPKKNGAPLKYIPFYFFPNIDIVKPAMKGLVNMNISHYKTTADYEHGLHLSIPTLFISGYTPEDGKLIYIGSSTAQALPSPDAQAYYAEVESEFEAHRKCAEEKERRMAVLGSRMLEQQKKQTETEEVAILHRSGEAATLQSMSIMLSKYFTNIIREVLEWGGESSEDVNVILNKDFVPFGINPQLITAMLQAVQMGEMSSEAFFNNLKKGELYEASDTFADEQAKIDNTNIPRP